MSWIDLLENDREFDVRVFAHNYMDAEKYLPQNWKNPVYVLDYPSNHNKKENIISLFPDSRYAKYISTRMKTRIPLADWYLKKVIGKWKPHIIHSLSVIPSGDFTWQSLSKIKKNRPLFVVSSWGTDVNMGKDIPSVRPKILEVLKNCDGFIADCARDVKNALNLGLPRENLAFDFAVPGNGGMNISQTTGGLPISQRNVILLPKAYEGFENKVLPVLEALNILQDKLEGFEVHLLVASDDVKRYLSLLPKAVQNHCFVHTQLRNDGVLDLMKRVRVMVAPSISDGTPITLLEAMTVGALPLMSPLASIKEWIEDGKNGLLAHALYPDKIAQALERALFDDELFHSAAVINREIIEKRANRQLLKPQIKNYYRDLLNQKGKKIN